MCQQASNVLALDCFVIFFNHTISVESTEFCGYVNYHSVMLFLCGALALLFLSGVIISTFCHVVCRCETNSIVDCAKMACGFIVLSIGFEIYLVILVLLCIFEITRMYMGSRISNFLLRCCPYRRNSNAVFDASQIISIVIEVPTQHIISESQLKGAIITAPSVTGSAQEEDEECPICYEPMGYPRFRTCCKHEFHHSCLSKWNKHSCPTCRGSI